MSFYFNIPTEKSVTYQALQNQLATSSVQFNWMPNGLEDAITNTKIYLPGKSTRGISIRKEEDGYSVGINVIASEEDFQLALDTTKSIAELTNGQILPEDREAMLSPDELQEHYNQAWIDDLKTLGVDLFLERVGNDGHVLSIGCCYMDYRIGPKVHQKLDSSSSVNYYHSLVKHIQQTQFFDRQKFQSPQRLTAKSKDGQKQTTYIPFSPSGTTFLAHADYVILPAGGEARYEIPYSMLEEVATDKFYRVDENQFIIDAISRQEYATLLQQIETELGKVPEEELRTRYSQFTDEELDEEFGRLMVIPNARTKIFALQRMSVLIGEYDKRGLQMPSKRAQQPPAKKAPPLQERKSRVHEVKNYQVVGKDKEKKPWWKFW